MSKSIIIKEEYMGYCAICGKPGVEVHHCVHGTANRRLSEEHGLIAPLCSRHHNSSPMSVHQNKEMKVLMHQFAQASWERDYMAKKLNEEHDYYGLDMLTVDEWKDEAREEFRRIFGQSWI